MLGTGHAMSKGYYNTCFIISGESGRFLVDGGGGNGIIKQLDAASINWLDITDIFLTHRHTDHILGIMWMMRVFFMSLKRGELTHSVNIYGNEDVCGILTDVGMRLFGEKEKSLLGNGLNIITVSDGEEKEILGRRVVFFDLHAKKAPQTGFAMDIGGGRKLICLGDEPYDESCFDYAVNSTWLMHEAYCLHSQSDIFRPYEKHHSSVKTACETAQRLGVENLIIYHTEDKTGAKRRELFEAEGKEYFSGGLFIPEDLETIEL